MNKILKRQNNNYMQKQEDSDALLMLSVASGNENAFRILVEKWKNPLINFFYRSLNDRFTAEELTQNTFIKIYRASNSYQAKAKFSTYLFFIATRVLLSEIRKRKSRPSTPIDPLKLPNSIEKSNPLKEAEIEEIFALSLENMNPNHKSAILLLKQQNLSYDEIAKVMDTTPKIVKSWIFRARQTIKEYFLRQS